MSAAEAGGRRTVATEASPTTASAGPAATQAGANTAATGTNEVLTGVRGVPTGSRGVPARTGGARQVGGTNHEEEEVMRRESEARVAEKVGTIQVAMFDNGAVQEELLIEG